MNQPVLHTEPYPDDETLLGPRDIAAHRHYQPRMVFSSHTPTEGTLRHRHTLRQRLARAACRAGLHFPTWNHQDNAYTCACRRILLGSEHIRP